MKRAMKLDLFAGLVVLLMVTLPPNVVAGPNAGGTLILHASPPDSTALCGNLGLAA
jgi:hypothetical protein